METRFAAFSCPIVDNPVTTDGVKTGRTYIDIRLRAKTDIISLVIAATNSVSRSTISASLLVNRLWLHQG